MPPGRPRIRVLSSRAEIVRAVAAAARRLDPEPTVRELGPADPPDPDALLLVDVGDARLSPGRIRAAREGGSRSVALVESAWADRMGEALAGDWFDYLFHPLNEAELGLVWRRHLSSGETPSLSLDVDEEGTIRLVCPSRVSHQRPAVDRVVEACRHLGGLDEDATFRLRVAVGEAVANAILYGNREDPARFVTIEADASVDRTVVRVTDEGSGFDPGAVPDPTGPGSLGRSRGRGLFLLRTLMDEVRHNEAGNEVTLVLRSGREALRRVRPLLAEYADLTGLRYRLVRRAGGVPEEVLYDAGLGPEGEGGEGGEGEVRALDREERDGTLRLAFDPGAPGEPPTPERAARFLLALVGAVADADRARDRLVERRLRRERVLAELEVARDLQLRLLPRTEDFADLARIAARCDPALSLGGDFYFLARAPGGGLGVMLGDVSSHGPSAALIMALTLSAAAAATRDREDPGEVLTTMHRQLVAALESTEMYMTLFYGIFDPEGRLRYANAGHPFAFRAAPGRLERLDALDPPIGMAPPADHARRSLPWAAGDGALLLFTDGLAEGLEDPTEGPRARLDALLSAGEAEPADLVEALFEGVDGARVDDRTALAVRPRRATDR